ncbi:atypical/RIO/RIO1 protein kinase [Coprinopsis cinerea okayama7|uniref:Serine/threonine-protein kinase RIO1 n=1 Tax=Coprinopsis cinerea (strain Okayama-7 / 130 / ATCC MYA-4618 / FGSC 9003) TaxID=240176 RepID=A8NSE1_COPC7|nr:atypical/RIO/RIO1 protein kinase [Coprinopsis cinerea okayama7\|eukprot:XP_001835991.2 atypical/RIO/RIO1 protein kinase [Coprinopsis cinerea okayama7\
MASHEVEPGQFDDAPEEINGRGNVAYIDTVDPSTEPQLDLDDHAWPPSSDEEDEDHDSLLDEDDYYDNTRVEDEDWDIAERDFTKQYNRLRQHVAVKTGNAQGSASATNQSASVAALPAVNIPKAVKAAKPTAAIPAGVAAKDRTTSQLEEYTKKYSSRLAKIDTPFTMGVGVNRKGPSAHANMKDKSDRATNEQVLDPRTRLILFKMIGRGLIHEVNGCVSTGKEANVYHATTPTKDHLALKIYKTSILVFKDRSKYVTGEYRFRRGYSRNPRKMVRLWAEKEMRNLRRLRAAGIESPEPVEVRENVLVMTFVGDRDGWASPRLKDAELTTDQMIPLYSNLLCLIRTMYHDCKLVHADLSEYNILYHEGRLCIIDVSQSVEHDHPSAFDFLRSDIKNVEEFFGKGGVQTLGIRKAFEFVTKEKLSEENEGMSPEEVLQKWLEEQRTSGGGDEVEEEKKAEIAAHEDEVFMKSYIPRTLNEVYDPERDVDRLTRGEGKQLIYAETIGVVAPASAENTAGDKEAAPTYNPSQQTGTDPDKDGEEEEGDEDEDGSEEEDDDEEEDQKRFEKKPRGHRHEDKEAKKVRASSSN